MSRHHGRMEAFAELSMQIATGRTEWNLRAWVLAEMLKAQGIDVEHILKADRAVLLEMLKDKTTC